MAKYQIIAVLLTPNGNYTETECPKGYADYMALDKAYENDDFDSMESILSNYEIENGAVEEHDTNADYIVDCDADGFYLLRKISEPKTTYTDNDMEEVLADIESYITSSKFLSLQA